MIYSNVVWKTRHDIKTPAFRGAFDFGYNHPLEKGKNVILIELEMDKDLPAEWDFSVVGGVEKLKFLLKWYCVKIKKYNFSKTNS